MARGIPQRKDNGKFKKQEEKEPMMVRELEPSEVKMQKEFRKMKRRKK